MLSDVIYVNIPFRIVNKSVDQMSYTKYFRIFAVVKFKYNLEKY